MKHIPNQTSLQFNNHIPTKKDFQINIALTDEHGFKVSGKLTVNVLSNTNNIEVLVDVLDQMLNYSYNNPS